MQDICWSTGVARNKPVQHEVPEFPRDQSSLCGWWVQESHNLSSFSYLERRYFFVVLTPPQPCSTPSQVTLLGQHHVILSSDVTATTKCGSYNFPWVVTAAAGLVLNVTLLDFTDATFEHDQRYTQCTVFATIRYQEASQMRTS